MLFFESISDLTSKDLDWKLMDAGTRTSSLARPGPTTIRRCTSSVRKTDDCSSRAPVRWARSRATWGRLHRSLRGRHQWIEGRADAPLTRHMISHPTGENQIRPARKCVRRPARQLRCRIEFPHYTETRAALYATEHDNDGPEGSNGRGSVKAGEWRHIDMSGRAVPHSCRIDGFHAVTTDEGSSINVSATAAPPIAKPWIELFEYFNYGGLRGRGTPDFFKDNFDEFGALDKGWLDSTRFDNLAASWRWFAPEPCSMRANQHSFDDSSFWRAQPDAVRNRCPPIRSEPGERDTGLGSGDMFQVVSSVQFSDSCSENYSAPLVVRWDLDFDGSKETTATTVTMSAARLDGPSDRALAIETCHPTDGSRQRRTSPSTSST